MTEFSELYEAASKGFHISETCGPDGKYHRISKFQTLAELQAFEDAWRKAMISVRESALSHAAGQDGEQCRAASGEVVAWIRPDGVTTSDAGLMRHWEAQGLQFEPLIRALSRGVPEGMVLVPRSSVVEAAIVCDEWRELFGGTPGFDKYEQFTYAPAVEALGDELRAIAAQRKDG